MTRPNAPLALKVFLGTAFIVVAVFGTGLAFASRAANSAARDAIGRALEGTRAQVQALLADRERAMLSGAGVFAQSALFRGIVESRNASDALDQSLETADQLGVDWVQITDHEGIRLAKSDDPGAAADTLTRTALIARALEGAKVSGYGISIAGDTLFQGVAVPIVRPPARAGAGVVVGVLMATRAIDSTFLASVLATAGGKTDVAVYTLDSAFAPRLTASTLGLTKELRGALAGWRPEETEQAMLQLRDDIVLNGDHYVRLGAPLLSAEGTPIGGFLALRSRETELAPFRALQRTILVAGAVGLLVAFVLSFLIARQIMQPVGELVTAARKAVDGNYGAVITIANQHEIGALARVFRALLSDLRDKQVLVEFLQGDSEPRTTVELHAMGATMQQVLSQDSAALERFKGEIRRASRVSHRNIVRMHELVEADGTHFISMEHVEGKSLKELIRVRGPIPAAATVAIGKQLLRALEVAHAQGVIHRDIKTQSVVVTPAGVVKVTDFGMTPGQLPGDDVDARVDLYAAGAVLYECLTGHVPFAADPPSIPAALADVVMRALDQNPANRPQTATEFHDALEAIR